MAFFNFLGTALFLVVTCLPVLPLLFFFCLFVGSFARCFAVVESCGEKSEGVSSVWEYFV